jgi:hypothetical protein
VLKAEKKRVIDLDVLAGFPALTEVLFSTTKIIFHVARLAALTGPLTRGEVVVVLLTVTGSLLTVITLVLLTSLILLTCAT